MTEERALVPAKNGALRDPVTGRIVSGKGVQTKITPESSIELHRKRQEKAAALLRKRITEETASISPDIRGSAAAVAEAGAMIWTGTVLNTEAYPRDRLDAWEKIGKRAGVLADDKQPTDQPTTVTNNVLVLSDDQAAVVRALLGADRKHETVDAEADGDE